MDCHGLLQYPGFFTGGIFKRGGPRKKQVGLHWGFVSKMTGITLLLIWICVCINCLLIFSHEIRAYNLSWYTIVTYGLRGPVVVLYYDNFSTADWGVEFLSDGGGEGLEGVVTGRGHPAWHAPRLPGGGACVRSRGRLRYNTHRHGAVCLRSAEGNHKWQLQVSDEQYSLKKYFFIWVYTKQVCLTQETDSILIHHHSQ